MINAKENKISLTFIDTCLAVIFLFAPHLALTYTFFEPNLGPLRLPFGNYILFFISLFCGLFFAFKNNFQFFSELKKNKTTWLLFFLFFVGVMFSYKSLENLRLFCIISILTGCALSVANFVSKLKHSDQTKLITFAILPFFIPVLVAVLLHLSGPLDFGLTLQNYTHENYKIPRWRFLHSSANGFGLASAVSCAFFWVAYFIAPKKVTKAIILCCFIVSFIALFFSGTRAAFIFALVSFFCFVFLRFEIRKFVFFVLASFLVLGSVIFYFGAENVKVFLRIGDSNGRLGSTIEIFNLFLQSPFVGRGFGFADSTTEIYPTNLFYPSLLLEIGIIGFGGVFILMILPLILGFWRGFNRKTLNFLSGEHFSVCVSYTILSSFFVYLFFEFNVIRVSAAHQFFIFLWGIIMFQIPRKLRNSVR